MSDRLSLISNENVLGPSPKAIAAIRQATAEMHRYPIEHEAILLDKLAIHVGGGLIADNFVTGNGSSDVLRMIMQTFMHAGGNSVIGGQTFGIYAGLTSLFGGRSTTVPLVGYRIDLQRVLDAIDEETCLAFICNPNNPTGLMLSHDEIEQFLGQVPSHVTVVLDEAYQEFADDSESVRPAAWIADGHNLIVTRTFSKLYGLASLRAGFGFGRIELLERVRRHKLHYNSGRITWIGAAAAIEDHEHVVRSRAMVHQGKAYYYQALSELGIGYLPTQSNFIFLKDLPMGAALIVEQAAQQNVILNRTDWCDLPDNIRITIARPDENERVIAVLRKVIDKG